MVEYVVRIADDITQADPTKFASLAREDNALDVVETKSGVSKDMFAIGKAASCLTEKCPNFALGMTVIML